MQVNWTTPAEEDLDRLFEYIAKESPIYAERFIDRILQAVTNIGGSPDAGRKVPEVNDEYIREVIVQSQRVIYAVDYAQKTVTVLALVHVRRDFPNKHRPT